MTPEDYFTLEEQRGHVETAYVRDETGIVDAVELDISPREALRRLTQIHGTTLAEIPAAALERFELTREEAIEAHVDAVDGRSRAIAKAEAWRIPSRVVEPFLDTFR